MSFESLGLVQSLTRAVREEGYSEPTSIQQQAIPHVLRGRDVLGCAQTGTGKTAAFALPILQYLDAHPRPIEPRIPRVLVLAPTRELAAQINDSFRTYGRHLRCKSTVIFGGVGYDKQVQALRAGVHVLVATPGRLLDLIDQKSVVLDDIEVLVLDEADRMLDMGFIHDVRKVLRELPKNKQTLFFSATMPPEIRALADDLLDDPAEVAVTPVATTAETVQQAVYFVEKADKRGLLVHLLQDPAVARSLVFSRTKHGANRIAEQLERVGIVAAAIHGNKSQNARERALAGFKEGTVRVLVATDIAARGIDVDGVTHVINFDLPNVPESYVHRIGRTGRAGASGIAWSFCDREERSYLTAIERTIRRRVPVVAEHPFAKGATGGHASHTTSEPARDARPPRLEHGSDDGRPRRASPSQQHGRSGGHASHGRGHRQGGHGNGHGRGPSHGGSRPHAGTPPRAK